MSSLSQLDDYKVDYRREELLASVALKWRSEAGIENSARFNIVRFIKDVLAKKLRRRFKIKFFNMKEGEKPAWVIYDPECILYVDHEIWNLADLGEPEAVFILAHEIGHLIFHDHYGKQFSNDPSLQIKAWEKQYSSEWQANTFAFYFLLPTHIVQSFSSLHEIVEACGLNIALVKQRLEWCLPIKSTGICKTCGSFDTDPSGKCLDAACNFAA